jgi:DNA-binding SARP family transcriptional activator/tetratricopeptide (TPR) repeat protein
VQFRVLGPVAVHTDDGRILTLPRRQERLLLAILALQAGQAVSIGRLCALLWDDNPPGPAPAALRTYVARIRSLLARADAPDGGVALVADRGGYVLRVAPELVDAHRFRRLVDAARHHPELAERDRLLREALGLWHGPALHHAADDRLRERLCADLEELRLQAVEASLATGLDLGRHHELLPELARLNAEHPVRERLVELHMLALYRQGRTAEALSVFHSARDRLADELGLDPGAGLHRLHQAMLRGEPLAAARPPAGTRVVPAQLPADLVGFTGRADHLRQLDALLAGDTTAVVISAIAGTAGVGKTTLAVHWAHRMRDRFPDGQLYLNLRGFGPTGSATVPEQATRRFLDALGVPARRIPKNLDGQVDLYRSLLAGKRMLIMLDNARDPEQVRPLLPGAPGCLTLVTSRERLTGLVAVDGAQPITLDLLTSDEARQLLAARLGQARVDAEPEAVDDLIGLCARLPLALAIAAARAATEPGLSLATLATGLRHTGTVLDTLTGDDAVTDIRTVFACSYQALRPPAARLFRLLGLHPGTDLGAPAAASLAGLPLAEVVPLLAELTRTHLVHEPVPGRYACHDLLRAFAIEQARSPGSLTEQARSPESLTERTGAQQRVLDHYLHTAYVATLLLQPNRDLIGLAPPHPGVAPEHLADRAQALDWFTAEQGVLVAAVELAAAEGFDTYAWQLSWTLWEFFDLSNQWHDWARVQHIALGAAQRVADRHVQARAHRGLALAYVPLGRYDAARAEFQQALRLLAGSDDLAGQARMHGGLGWVCSEQERYAEALGHAEQALRLYQAAGHQQGQAQALNSLGWYHAHLGNHRETLRCCTAALALFEELGDWRAAGSTWDSLGYAHHHLGQYRQAVDAYQRALDLRRGDRYRYAATLRRLGDTRLTDGSPTAAAEAWQEARAILDELDHPEAAEVSAKLDLLHRTESART